MEDQNKNLILATALSFVVILVWFFLFPPPEPAVTADPAAVVATDGSAAAPVASVNTPSSDAAASPQTAVETLAAAPRVEIETPRLKGSLSLLGGRIDDIRLKDFRETLDEGSDIVTVMAPLGSDHAYYALYGWAPAGGLAADAVPNATTLWQLEAGSTLTPTAPVTLVWDNGAGLTEEEQKRLFLPFSQINGDEQGHGLGLSIVRQIVAKLSGQVGVEARPGAGSRFSFTLPLVDDRVPPV